MQATELHFSYVQLLSKKEPMIDVQCLLQYNNKIRNLRKQIYEDRMENKHIKSHKQMQTSSMCENTHKE